MGKGKGFLTESIFYYNIELSNANIKGELVTPTGAAIVAAVRTDTALPQHFTIKKTGYGAGKREYELPGVLRAMLIESNSESLDENADLIYKLETDIDDCSSEILGYTMERLYKAGAREVHFLPIYMKKNRPAYELVVSVFNKYSLSAPASRSAATDISPLIPE
jgi:pyridinium-3,5-bisthiocarboxylic acid mononucleotide nickel chelatase